jgi:hypothetical protein
MEELPPQLTRRPRHCQLTSSNRQQLEAKVLELILQGWIRVGEIAVAKSVIDSEPPYLCQAMVEMGNRNQPPDGDKLQRLEPAG